MALVYLNMLAHGRSGDKGDTSNVCVTPVTPRTMNSSSGF